MSHIRRRSIAYPLTAASMALSIQLTAQLAHAQQSSDTFTGTAKQVVDYSGAISNYYTIAQAAVALAQAMGILDDPNQDVLSELQMLQAQIDQVAGAITWDMSETDRENRLYDLRAVVEATYDSMSNGSTIDWANLDRDAAQTVAEGKTPAAFWRYHIDSQTDGILVNDPYAGDFTWKTLISYTPSDLQYDSGFVYDWRLGVPSLTQLIGLRIQLMAMEDANFAHDGRFFSELQDDQNALLQHIANIYAGVRCNVWEYPPFSFAPDVGSGGSPNYSFWVSCADIFTGLNNTRLLVDGNAYPLDNSGCIQYTDLWGNPVYDQSCLDQLQKDYKTWYAQAVQAPQDQAYRNVLDQTPYFGLQALASTIALYKGGVNFVPNDFNVDGHPDLVWYNGANGQTIVWALNGATHLSPALPDAWVGPFSNSTLPQSAGWTMVGTADFDHDRRSDLLWYNGTTGQLAVWFLNGTTHVYDAAIGPASTSTIPDTEGWTLKGINDFDNDGNVDLLWYNGSTGQLAVWFLNGVNHLPNDALIGPASNSTIPSSLGWEIKGTSDFDNDGSADVLWYNGSTGEIAIWYLNGTTHVRDESVHESAGPTVLSKVPVSTGWTLWPLNRSSM